MRVYFDSSALIKRSVEEAESDALEGTFMDYAATDTVILSSTLAWIEVSRALRGHLRNTSYSDDEIRNAIDRAMAGVAERLITEDVVSLARRLGPPSLRTLDAIHVSSAILLDVDAVVAYDDRLIDACRRNGLATVISGR